MVKKNNLLSKLVPWRMWVQSIFLLVWLDPLALRLHGMCCPVFHCYACPLATFACPIGVIAQFGGIHIFPFIAIGLLVVVGVLFGSLVCGWACPFGFLQDLAARAPTRKFDPPKWTGHLRYVVLIVTVLAVPYLFGEGHPLFICRICPAGALEAAVPNITQQAIAGQTIVWPNALKLTILILFLVAVFFVKRPWCRILCPLGGFFSLFNRISAFFLRLNPEKCNDCKRCHKLCEYGIQPQISPNDSACIRCLECTRCGPEALTFGSAFQHREKPSAELKPERSQANT
ncbi:MAG TPA: 4Fe-4S binding protein [Sedimentisphaerales bacterium]|nr:4Fe-4S binding protein [Sedimentisphaerales bacterium]